MADTKNKANDPQEEVKIDSPKAISTPEGDPNENQNTTETTVEVAAPTEDSPKKKAPEKNGDHKPK